MDLIARLKFLLICVISLIYGVSLSLPSPFYPTQAEARGLSSLQSGVVVGTSFLTTMISTPIAAKMIHKLGAEAYLIIGKYEIRNPVILYLMWKYF